MNMMRFKGKRGKQEMTSTIDEQATNTSTSITKDDRQDKDERRAGKRSDRDSGPYDAFHDRVVTELHKSLTEITPDTDTDAEYSDSDTDSEKRSDVSNTNTGSEEGSETDVSNSNSDSDIEMDVSDINSNSDAYSDSESDTDTSASYLSTASTFTRVRGQSSGECSKLTMSATSSASNTFALTDESIIKDDSFSKEARAREARANDREYRRNTEKRLRKMHYSACNNLKESKLDKALEGFEDILFILVGEYGEQHKRVATALHNLSIAHLRSGNLEDAADAIEEAIKIRKRRIGHFSTDVADSLVELGLILLAQKKYEDSLEIFDEALDLRERAFVHAKESEKGQIKLQISKILNNIGCANYEFGELRDARIAFEQSHATQRACFEEGKFASMPGFLAMSSTMCNLGFSHMETKDWESAIFQLEEGLKIQHNVLEHTNVIVMGTIDNLAYSHLMSGAFDKALKYYTNLLLIIKSTHDKYDLDLTATLRKKAYCEIKLFDYDEALKTLKKIETILENNLDPINDLQLEEIEDLTNELQDHIYRFPGLPEYVSKVLSRNGYRSLWNDELLCQCGYNIDNDEEIDLIPIMPKAPQTLTKTSGHRISFA